MEIKTIKIGNNIVPLQRENLKLEQKKLSDGSKVYEIVIGNVRIYCPDEKWAIDAYFTIDHLFDQSSGVDIG